MKLKGLLVCILLLVGTTSAFALDATLTVGEGFYTAGGTVTVPIVLKTNGNSISAVALDVEYDTTLLSSPVGTLGVAASTAKKALYSNVLAPTTGTTGKYRLLITGGMTEDTANPKGGTMTDVTTTGTSGLLVDGVVALVKFNVASSVTGTVDVQSAPAATDPVANQVAITGAVAGMLAGKAGDCNGDGSVNIFDVINTVNIIFQKPGFAFNSRCDINMVNGVWNPDGGANVFDIVSLVNVILAKPGWNLP